VNRSIQNEQNVEGRTIAGSSSFGVKTLLMVFNSEVLGGVFAGFPNLWSKTETDISKESTAGRHLFPDTVSNADK
jgi:hypothetical protein